MKWLEDSEPSETQPPCNLSNSGIYYNIPLLETTVFSLNIA
jgi:hypothetical protein